jgi:predicted TIM-barrel fold metal-dependent hydrolase
MMKTARAERLAPAANHGIAMVSSDAHVMEPDKIWDALPQRLRKSLPKIRFGDAPPGGSDPRARVADQDIDGVAAEILFPNYCMALFGVEDVELQLAAFKIYNDWVADFCRAHPRRLFGMACISLYDVQAGIAELQRASDLGLKGAMIWQVPDPRLPFTSDHYERFWSAAAELSAPVNCHILTGHSYAKALTKPQGPERVRQAVNQKTDDTIRTLFDLVFSGVFDRHPKLKVVLAESEIGWAPFILQQWDYYWDRYGGAEKLAPSRPPSEVVEDHVYLTFIDDYAGTRNLAWWGQTNCMWSNDYPHFNMSFPHSRANVEHHLGGLPDDVRRRLLRENAVELYGLPL